MNQNSLSKIFILSGSARQDGNTQKTIETFLLEAGKVVHLCALNIAPYLYNTPQEEDDFLPLVREMLEYPIWLFATPVYWYSMSGLMKTFWDRITNLMTHHRPLLEGLKGKRAGILVSSAHEKPEGFEWPLVKTFAYLGMVYEGCWARQFPEEARSEPNDLEAARMRAWLDGLKVEASVR